MKDLSALTITEASQLLKKGETTSVELTNACLDRIEKNEPELDAFITVTAGYALKKAAEADKRLKENKNVTPLTGIPYSMKDLFNTKNILTTAASKILDSYIPPYNATVYQRLEDAGAVLIGKTNMDAFAHGSSTETSDYKVTKNPWDKKRLPGGSSGGSAAAVATGMGLFSVGTETAGSIRQPASWCGITGLKPTYGRVSRYGVIAMGSSLDCPGPMCKNVEDAALVLEVIAGHDPKDATSYPDPVEPYFTDLKEAKGLKIGLPGQYFDKERIEKDILDAVTEAVAVLGEKNVLVPIDLLDPQYAISVYTLVCRAEVSSNLARYDGVRYGYTSNTPSDTWNDHYRTHRGEGFGNEAKRRIMTGTYALSAGYQDKYYKRAEAVRNIIRNDLEQAFTKVDAIIGPTTPSTALEIGSTEGNPLFGEIADVLIEASTLSGNPGISIPVGFDKNNLPIGMNIFAPRLAEQTVLDLAYTYQKSTTWHTMKPDIF